jgi:hypothetical protein
MATGVPLINGAGYSWAQIQCLIGGALVQGITSIEYDDKEEVENVYGAGQYPVERGNGKIECSAKLTLLMSEVEALQQKSATGRIQDLGVFDIVVSYLPSNGIVKTHTIKNCQFKNNDRKVKTGDAKIEVDLDLVCSHIIWK